MRGIDLFCASEAATSVRLTSMDHHQASSSSSSTVYLGSSRLIDRHNPIINHSARFHMPPRKSVECATENSYDLLPTPQDILNPTTDPASSGVLKSPPSILKNAPENENAKKNKKKKDKKSGINSDFVSRISCAKGGGFISPSGSTRFLLGDRTGLLEHAPDREPVVPTVPCKPAENKDKYEINGKKIDVEAGLVSNRGSSSRSSDQVVVLRVSLHCKGCAGKVKKHISRMQGVTSFNIDFAAKKVTVTGDVTPLEVLASISKVKTAKLWTPPKQPSHPSTTPSIYSDINKSKRIIV